MNDKTRKPAKAATAVNTDTPANVTKGFFARRPGVTPPVRSTTSGGDPMVEYRDRMVRGVERQIGFLQGKQGIKGRQWFVQDPDGSLKCGFRYSDQVIKVDDKEYFAPAAKVQEAIAIYQEAIEAIKAGEFNDAIMAVKATTKKGPKPAGFKPTVVADEKATEGEGETEESEAA